MSDDLFADAARQVLADQCTPDVVRAIEAAGRAAPEAAALWAQLEATGLADALLPEDQGGAGLGLTEVFGVLEQCGAHALPLPLAETLLARALLVASGVERPVGSIALAHGTRMADGGLRCPLVRSGAVAASVLVQAEGVWQLLPVDGAQVKPQALALDAAFTWTATQAQAAPRVAVPADVFTLQAALIAAQMAGALMVVFQRTLQYANERQQFGRPIGKFQAIQHQLAVMSEHVFAARMAAQLGCSGAQALHLPDRLRVATAKARCSEAALAVSEFAHAIHGAIGFTAEYELQLFTRRLHAWRQSAGSESYWHDVAGEALLAQDSLTLDVVRRITDLAPTP